MFYQLQARREEQLKKEEEERKMREEKYGNASPSVSGRETNPDPGTRCHISKQIKINYDISHLLYNLLKFSYSYQQQIVMFFNFIFCYPFRERDIQYAAVEYQRPEGLAGPHGQEHAH